MKKSYSLPKDLRYSLNHEWVRIVDEKTAVVGITDYAFEEGGGVGTRTILSIELPNVGKRVNQTESIATIETEKTVSDVYSPLSGEILEINAKLRDDPTPIGLDPYGEGWIVKLNIDNSMQIRQLMDSQKYREYVDESQSTL